MLVAQRRSDLAENTSATADRLHEALKPISTATAMLERALATDRPSEAFHKLLIAAKTQLALAEALQIEHARRLRDALTCFSCRGSGLDEDAACVACEGDESAPKGLQS